MLESKLDDSWIACHQPPLGRHVPVPCSLARLRASRALLYDEPPACARLLMLVIILSVSSAMTLSALSLILALDVLTLYTVGGLLETA